VSCEEVRHQLPDHVLGTLLETEMATVRRHLRGCASCRAEASELGQGLALFARAAHTAEPPPELKAKVMAILSEDWTEESAVRPPRGFVLRWPAIAAVMVLLAGALGWATIAQVTAVRHSADAGRYERFLEALGGKEVRVGTFGEGTVELEGTAILYDSLEGGQSWVLVLARASGYSEPLVVRLRTPGGRSLEIGFPLEFEENGSGWTGMVTEDDITSFSVVELVAPDGSVVSRAPVVKP